MRLPFLLPVAAVCGCVTADQPSQPLESTTAQVTEVRYQVVKLPSLGGAPSRGLAINEQGWVAGFSTLPDGSRRAALWRNFSVVSLGTLGGPNSSVPWPGLNNAGMVVGISQTGGLDPLNEDWSCEAGPFIPPTNPRQICRGFYWLNGAIHELPTLGGTHGFATAVNDWGEVVGWAETDVHDPTCTGVQELGFRAVIWEPKTGTSDRIKTRELSPFPGDAASAATAINENHEVVGISGDCDQAVGRFSAVRAVLWKNNRIFEIPNLGGKTWHTPMDINDLGVVVGFSNPPGEDPAGSFIAHAFIWSGGAAATDLGTLDQDPLSEAFAINNHGQVVGVSFGGANGLRAFLYEDGVLMNLNDLVDTEDVLLSAQDINEAGQITGRLRDHVTGETLAFVATPLAVALRASR